MVFWRLCARHVVTVTLTGNQRSLQEVTTDVRVLYQSSYVTNKRESAGEEYVYSHVKLNC